MPTLIHDTTIVTVDDKDSVHFKAAILIEGDRIAAIGPSKELLQRHPQAERIDGGGKAVMPGFANLHTHFVLTLARGIYEDLSPPHKPPFDGGLSPIPLPKLGPEERRTLRQLGALEAIRSGTTLALEDATDNDISADLLAASGLRLMLCERVWDRVNASIGQPTEFERDAGVGETGLRKFAALHKSWDGSAEGRIRVGIAPWAPDMCSPELLRDTRAEQQRTKTIASIHLNQIWGEVAAVQRHRNRLPTEFLADCGFLSDRMIAAHCRCMTDEEQKLLGAAGVTVAFNSAIAARRGLSPRIDELERAGCRITIGTDNMAEDMIEATRTGMFMERIRRQDGRRPSPEQALAWATRNGYQALGIADGGWLAAGNKADLIVVDLQRAHLVPLARPVSSFVHQGQPHDVSGVMVDGRWLMREGRVLTMDEEAVVAAANRVGLAAWKRLFAERPDLTPPPGFDLSGG